MVRILRQLKYKKLTSPKGFPSPNDVLINDCPPVCTLWGCINIPGAKMLCECAYAHFCMERDSKETMTQERLRKYPAWKYPAGVFIQLKNVILCTLTWQ